MNLSNNENKMLKLLAVAIVENPRGTIKELAEAVGISKATLHRTYGTRENLEKLLMEKALEVLQGIISRAENSFKDYREGLKALVDAHFENKEFIRWMCVSQMFLEGDYWISYSKAIDAFFLHGQKEGVFRIDFNVQFLSEAFVSIISGMIDAERRGRVASSCTSETIENFFLYGALNE